MPSATSAKHRLPAPHWPSIRRLPKSLVACIVALTLIITSCSVTNLEPSIQYADGADTEATISGDAAEDWEVVYFDRQVEAASAFPPLKLRNLCAGLWHTDDNLRRMYARLPIEGSTFEAVMNELAIPMTDEQISRSWELDVAADRKACEGVDRPQNWREAMAWSTTGNLNVKSPTERERVCSVIPAEADTVRSSSVRSVISGDSRLFLESFGEEFTGALEDEFLEWFVVVGRHLCDGGSIDALPIPVEPDDGIGDGAGPLAEAEDEQVTVDLHGAEVAAANCPGVDFRRVEMPFYSFSVPVGFEELDAQDVDTVVRSWAGDGIRVSLDPRFSALRVISGIEPTLVKYSGVRGVMTVAQDNTGWKGNNEVSVYFPVVTSDFSLNMLVLHDDPADEIIGRCIVSSLEWVETEEETGYLHGAEVAATNCPGVDFRRVEMPQYSFSVPVDFEDLDAHNADKEVRSWTGDGIQVSLNMSVDTFRALPDVESVLVSYSGVPGVLMVAQNNQGWMGNNQVGVFFSLVTSRVNLNLVVLYDDPADEIIGRCIVSSVEWNQS